MSVNPAKCVFATTSLTFLGHVFDKDGYLPNPDCIVAIQNLSRPSNKKGLQRFLGSINFYHRLVPNATTLLAPLYDLAASIKNRDGPLLWTDATRAAFDACRNALAFTAILVHPKPKGESRLRTDVSSVSIDAIIEQKDDEDW